MQDGSAHSVVVSIPVNKPPFKKYKLMLTTQQFLVHVHGVALEALCVWVVLFVCFVFWVIKQLALIKSPPEDTFNFFVPKTRMDEL